MVLTDYAAYIERQQRVGGVFADLEQWHRMSIINVARMGNFSADRAIAEYCRDIWQVDPVPVDLPDMPCDNN